MHHYSHLRKSTVATNLSAEVRHATNYLSCRDDSGNVLFFRNGGNAPSALVLEWEVQARTGG
jgi:hypothetical protein